MNSLWENILVFKYFRNLGLLYRDYYIDLLNMSDCKPTIRRPNNGLCPEEYPFLAKTKKNNPCCYKKPRFGAISKTTHRIGEEYDPNIQILLEKGIVRARPSTGEIEEFILEQLLDPKDVQLIIYDLETTGLPYRDKLYGTNKLIYPRVVQIALYNATTGEEFVTYVNPMRKMSVDAQAITGIDPQILKNYPTFDELLPHIVDFTLKGADDKTQILMMAHNGTHFDEPTLKAEFERYWDRHPEIEDPMPLNWIFGDTLELALSWINPENVENFKESTLYAKFVGEDLEGAHDALADVKGLWKILSALFKDIYGRNDLPFIYAKVLEYIFYSQLHDFDYLAEIVPNLIS